MPSYESPGGYGGQGHARGAEVTAGATRGSSDAQPLRLRNAPPCVDHPIVNRGDIRGQVGMEIPPPEGGRSTVVEYERVRVPAHGPQVVLCASGVVNSTFGAPACGDRDRTSHSVGLGVVVGSHLCGEQRESSDTNTVLESVSREVPGSEEPGEGWSRVTSRGGGVLSKSRLVCPPGGGCPPPLTPLPQVLDVSNSFSVLAVEEGGDDPLPSSGDVDRWPRRPRVVPFGSVEAHARFLQHVFRRTVRRRPGCWRVGGLKGLSWWRPPTVFACRNGLLLATKEQRAAQVAESQRVLAWYDNYVRLHKRWHSLQTPNALVTFCGEGGVSEGVRLAGGASHGIDSREMPRFVRRFGAGRFTQGDGRKPLLLRECRDRLKAVVTMASPPCKAYTTSLMRGRPKEPAMIQETRRALIEGGGLYVIENVTGAGSAMVGQKTLLKGAYFGLGVDRPRVFESNFKIHVDKALSVGGEELRGRSCLGHRRRWRRLDPFGRPEMAVCCCGDLWAVQGDKPYRCTAVECAAAMGIDADHMSYEGLAQAIPPAYGRLVFAQACMRDLEREFGIEPITYDAMKASPVESRRQMGHWLRGSGGESPDQGVVFEKAPSKSAGVDGEGGEQNVEGTAVGAVCGLGMPKYQPLFKGESGATPVPPNAESVRAAELRELDYSWAGDFDAVWSSEEDLACLALVKPRREVKGVVFSRGEGALRWNGGWGENLLVCGELSVTMGAIEWARAWAHPGSGRRVTIEAKSLAVEARAKQAGFELVRRIVRGAFEYASTDRWARGHRVSSFWSRGGDADPLADPVDYDALEGDMDPQDRQGAPKEAPCAKAARSYMPIPWEPRRWDVGLPEELDQMMAKEGASVHAWNEPGFSEVPFYPFASDVGLMKSIVEADRALVVGAMEYVPAGEIDAVRVASTIHPWTIVDQGGDKWRLCHDYSVGTNRVASTAPFALPSVWDVSPCVKPGSHFAKYDIRDGFWHCPVAPSSRKRLVVRHPGTGRLMWATRLPFGYLDSPRLFCKLTEEIVERVRRRVGGRGIHLFVFVDDVLCVGDTEELTRKGMELIEEEFATLGVQWAPHKKRGPCRCIEFLGLVLANTGKRSGVTLSRKRLTKLQGELDAWLRLEDAERREAEPRATAQLLGRLVFASQVVPNGRTYMQGMLGAFKGTIVDWKRGTVSFKGRPGQRLELSDAFWRDLAWWGRCLAGQAFTPFARSPPVASAVLAGTDASGWGTGQVVWRSGGREEHSLVFTAAEKRRPINWRELLGIWRAAQIGGERLRGRTLLVESDNMAAVSSSRSLSSKAADMQELVRRLLKLSRRHGFALKVTHTPGEKLDRPDQTSRGDAVELPRVRLTSSAFAHVCGQFGYPTELIGAEHEHSATSSKGGCASHLWVHPTYNTVGSALRLVGERLSEGNGANTTCLALVPEPSGEQWNAMLKHGLVVGRYEPGSQCFEANVLGTWRRTDLRRPACLVLFPRAAGATPRKVGLTHRESMTPVALSQGMGVLGAGYHMATDGRSVRWRVLPGSFVYSLPSAGCEFGILYRVCEATTVELEGDPDVIVGQEFKRAVSGAAKKLVKSKPGHYACEGWHEEERFRVNPNEVWTVDHLVEMAGGGKTFDRCLFDAGRATVEIQRRQLLYPLASNGGWQLSPPVSVSSSQNGYGEYVHLSTPGSSEGGSLVAMSVAARDVSAARGTSPVSEAMDEVIFAIDNLNVASANRGAEGVVPAAEWRAKGLATEGDREGAVCQPCPYAGMQCGGCNLPFKAGETVKSVGGGLVQC